MRLLSSIVFLERFEGEHEADDFHDLGPTWPVQAVAMPGVIVLAEVGGELVTFGWASPCMRSRPRPGSPVRPAQRGGSCARPSRS